jgi:hypothetical protein
VSSTVLLADISDTGVLSTFKEAYRKINALEQELTDMHRKMASDPEGGISVLIAKSVDEYSRERRSRFKDTDAWNELIQKHKS